MYCNKEIELSDKASGRWLPYNMDGSAHECKNQSQKETSTGTKTLKEGQIGTPQQFVREVMEGLKLKELDDRLKRVEALLFKGDKK